MSFSINIDYPNRSLNWLSNMEKPFIQLIKAFQSMMNDDLIWYVDVYI